MVARELARQEEVDTRSKIEGRSKPAKAGAEESIDGDDTAASAS